MEEVSKDKLYELLSAYAKENDELYIENNKLKAQIREAINYLDKHRFNKVNELKAILRGYDDGN